MDCGQYVLFAPTSGNHLHQVNNTGNTDIYTQRVLASQSAAVSSCVSFSAQPSSSLAFFWRLFSFSHSCVTVYPYSRHQYRLPELSMPAALWKGEKEGEKGEGEKGTFYSMSPLFASFCLLLVQRSTRDGKGLVPS